MGDIWNIADINSTIYGNWSWWVAHCCGGLFVPQYNTIHHSQHYIPLVLYCIVKLPTTQHRTTFKLVLNCAVKHSTVKHSTTQHRTTLVLHCVVKFSTTQHIFAIVLCCQAFHNTKQYNFGILLHGQTFHNKTQYINFSIALCREWCIVFCVVAF